MNILSKISAGMFPLRLVKYVKGNSLIYTEVDGKYFIGDDGTGVEIAEEDLDLIRSSVDPDFILIKVKDCSTMEHLHKIEDDGNNI